MVTAQEECVCCVRVCVELRVLREPQRSTAADRPRRSPQGGNILERHTLEKSAADPNEASWVGAWREVQRQRRETERGNGT